jgi:hypothetical protein
VITEQDLRAAIAECQGERDPNANTCIKLAAYFTILNAMYHEQETPIQPPAVAEKLTGYSYQGEPKTENTITIDSGSEFAESIDGRSQSEVWPILDEFVGTIQILNKPLYNALILKLKE